MKKSYRIFLILLFACLLSGCFERYSRAASTSATRLDPEEQAAMEMVGSGIGYIVKNVTAHEESLKIWSKNYDKDGFFNKLKTSYHDKRYYKTRDNLVSVIKFPIDPNQRRTVFPKSMDKLVYEARRFLALKHKINLDNPSSEDYDLIIKHARLVRNADKQLGSEWRKRPRNFANQEFDKSLTLQLAGIPLRLEFLQGKINVTHTQNVGPLIIDGAFGMSSGSGIKTLIIQNSEVRRVYAIGNRKLEMKVPASILTVDKGVITLTAIDG